MTLYSRSVAAAVLVVALTAAAGHAALFSANAFFSQAPSSQLGPIVSNSIVINNGPGSITVSGVVKVQVPPGAVSGTLIEWNVDRLLSNSYPSGNLITVTTLAGFSQPPGFGTYGNTSGFTAGFFDQYPAASKSNIPLTLTNGAATWNQITVQSTPFFYTAANGLHYLRQRFELDGVQLNGIGGLWTIDLPITTEVKVVPEPGAAGLALAGLGATVAICRRRTARRRRGATVLNIKR